MASEDDDALKEMKKQMYTITMNPNQKLLRSKLHTINNKNRTELNSMRNDLAELLTAQRIPRAKLKQKSETSSNEKQRIVFTRYEEDLNAKYSAHRLPYAILNDFLSFGSIGFPLFEKMKYNKLLSYTQLISRCVLIQTTIDNEQAYAIKIIAGVDADKHCLYLNDFEDMNNTGTQCVNYDDDAVQKGEVMFLIEYAFYYPKEEALCFVVSDLLNKKQLLYRDDDGYYVYSGFLIREDFKFYKSSLSMDISAASLEDLSHTYTSIAIDLVIKAYQVNNIFALFLFNLEYELVDQSEPEGLSSYVLNEGLINRQLCLILAFNEQLKMLFVRNYSTGQFEWLHLPIEGSFYINQMQGKAVLASIVVNKPSFWSHLKYTTTSRLTSLDDITYDFLCVIPKAGIFQSFECGKCMYTIGQFDSQICYSCLKVFHTKCLEENYLSLMLNAFYFCDKCRLCFNCKTASPSDSTLSCTQCNKAYHFQCLLEPIKSAYSKVDPKAFKCDNCLVCSQCNCTPYTISQANKFNQQCDMCLDCERRRAKKEYCPICNQIWRSQETQLIECKCKFWIHRECDRALTDAYYSHIARKKYHCALCRVKKKTKRLYHLLKQLVELDDEAFFINPVDTKHIPNYSKVIKTPMCFQLIETKLRESNYYLNEMSMFVADVNLIFDNAMVYNKPNDYIHKVAHSLKIECNRILNENYSFLYQMSFEYYLFEYYQPDLTIDQLQDIVKEKFPHSVTEKMSFDHVRDKIDEYNVKWLWLNDFGFTVLADKDQGDQLMSYTHPNAKTQMKSFADTLTTSASIVNNANSYKYKSFKTNEIQLELDLHNSNFEAPRKSSRLVHNSTNTGSFNNKMEINENGFDLGLPLKEEDDMVMKEYDHAKLTEKKLCFLYPAKYKDYSTKCSDRSAYVDFINSFLAHKEEKKKNAAELNGNKKLKAAEVYNKKYEDEAMSFQSDSSYERKKKGTKKRISNLKNHSKVKLHKNNQVENDKDKANDKSFEKKEVSVDESAKATISGHTNKKELPVVIKDKQCVNLPCQVCFTSIELILEKNCFLCGSFEDQDVFITCSLCFENYHAYCVSSSLKDVSKIQSYAWKCQNCKVCEKCNRSNDSAQLLYCNICDKATHPSCLEQAISLMPQCKFKCETCFECLHCQSKAYYSRSFPLKKDKDYSFFTRNFDYCYECGIKLFYNSLCAKCHVSDFKNFNKQMSFISAKEDFLKLASNSDLQEEKGKDAVMLYCASCKSWYHSKCIGFDFICITNYFAKFDVFNCLDCHLKTCYTERFRDLACVSYLEVLKLSFKLMCFTKIAMILLKSYQNDPKVKLHSKLIKIFLKDNYALLLQNKSIAMFIELMKIDVYILRDKKQKKKKKAASSALPQEKSIKEGSVTIHNDSVHSIRREEKELPVVVVNPSIEKDKSKERDGEMRDLTRKAREASMEEILAQVDRMEEDKIRSCPFNKRYLMKIQAKFESENKKKSMHKGPSLLFDINSFNQKKVLKSKMFEESVAHNIRNMNSFVMKIKFNPGQQNEYCSAPLADNKQSQPVALAVTGQGTIEAFNRLRHGNDTIQGMTNERKKVGNGEKCTRKRLKYKGEGAFQREIAQFFNDQNESSYFNGNIPSGMTDFYSFDLSQYYTGQDTNSHINNDLLNEVMTTCLSFIKLTNYSSSLQLFISKIILNAIIFFREILLQWLITQLTSTDMALFKDSLSDDPTEEELAKYLDQVDPLTPSPNKSQECEFCARKGGRTRSGRLIHLKNNLWGHINCVYWSKGVIVEPNGVLSNVNSSLNKISQSKCLLCKKSGATVICRVPKCGRPFHFICALIRGFTFTKDNEVFCNRCTHCQKDDSHISSLETKRLFVVDKKCDGLHSFKYQVGYYNKFGNATMLKFIQINSKDFSYESLDIGIVKYINDHILLFQFNDKGALLANCVFNGIKEFEDYALKTNLLNCYSKSEMKEEEVAQSPVDIVRYSPKNDFCLSLNYCLNKQERNESIVSLLASMNKSLPSFLIKTVCESTLRPKDGDDVLKFFNFHFELCRIFSNQPELYLKQNIEIDQLMLRNGINTAESFETKQKKNLKNRLELFVAQIKTKNKTPDIDDNVKLRYSICFKFDNYIEKHQQFLTGRRLTADIEMKDFVPQEDTVNQETARKAKLQKQSYKNLNKTMSTNLMEEDIPLSMKYRNYKALRPKVSIGPSRIHRNGLFATDNFQPGEIVIEYVGEFITNKVADYREKEYNLRGFGDCYMFRVDPERIIDATKFGNLARFINHSCDPNCSAQSNEINGKKHIILYAKKMIKNGEEITYDYNFESETEKIQCRCGAQNCQGRLN